MSKLPWIIDSGATDHMTSESSQFTCVTRPSRHSVQIADGSITPVEGAGSLSLSSTLPLSSVLHVPNLSNNLLSISQITNMLNCSVIFFSTHCIFQDLLTKKTIGIGKERGGLYYLETLGQSQIQSGRGFQAARDNVLDREKILLWHRRLGHPSFIYLERLFPKLFTNISASSLRCEHCIYAKNHRVSFPPSFHKSVSPFSRIHTDVWGPFSIPTSSGARYFISFIDDCTRVCWVYLMKSKSEVSIVIPKFHQLINTQFHVQIQVFHSDNGREFVNHSLTEFFQQHGIIHQTTTAYTPQQNGIAERKNRHLLDVARSLCFTMQVPKQFWADAVMTAVFLINRMPTRVLDYQTPIKVLSQFHSIPSLLNLPPKIFGCLCYVHVHSIHRDKLDPRALKCVFLGYPPSQKGYKCFHPPSGKTYVSMDVEFCEQESYFSGGVSTSPLQGEIRSTEEEKLWFEAEIGPCYVLPTQGEGETSVEHEIGSSSILPTQDEGEKPVTLKTFERRKKKHVDVPLPPPPDPSLHDTTIQSNDSSENDLQVHASVPILSLSSDIDHVAPLETPLVPHYEDRGRRYPIRDRHPPEKFGFPSSNNVKYPISNYISYHRLSKSHLTFTQQLSSVSIPNKFQEALDDPKWKSAMVEEMKALQKNSTWEMVELPRDKKIVGCKWVFTVKQNSDGSIERYKARLVAKGYTQTYGIDYQETFAPVAKMSTIRVLLSLAANLDWPLKQFDVKNAFLHGDLQEEVYMDPPPGFTPKGGKVCRLRKALYGLKQSPRAWFGRFSHSMRNYGFKQSQADHTLFLKRVGSKITLLIVYVDDMVVTGNDEQEIENLQSYLAKEFEMKNLGSLKYFLGIEVARSKKGIFLSQRKYVLDLLAETGKLACEPINTPMEVNHGLSIYPDQIPTNKERYQRLVGKLIYLAHTRPDLSYAVSVVSQFMHNPSEAHQGAVDRILRYLKYTPGKGILFSKHGHLDVESYTDSDFAGSKLDRKSTSGYVSFVGGNLVTWRSKKQGVVSRSSAEAEYRALCHGITELLWLKILMRELGFEPKKAMVLYCDNTAAIEIANNPVHHERTKHIDIDRHFISEKLAKNVIRVPYIKSEDQLADMMTHAVSSRELYSSLDKLGMCDIHAPT